MNASRRPAASYVTALVTAAIIVAADQATKRWMLANIFEPPRRITLAPFLDFVPVWNRGITFGLFNTDGSAQPIVFTAVALVIVAVLLVWLRQVRRWWVAAAIGAVLGGALGNMADRLRFGAVVDFIDFHVAGWHWWAFNVADSAICVAVALLALDALKGDALSGAKE
ncbi:MAG: signal peptidase II [Gemmatimonas sp.]